MSTNAIVFAWNRPTPGREKLSAAHFQEFVEYLGTQQQEGSIKSFDTVLLEPHGGDFNGFFLIRAETAKLDALLATPQWHTHILRASLHLDGVGTIRAFTGEAIAERISRWKSQIPG